MTQLRWEGECQNVASPLVTLDVTSFGNSQVEEKGTITVAKAVPALGRKSACLFSGYQHDRGPIGSLKWHCRTVRRHKTRHFREVLARDIREPLKVGKEPIGSP